jgi:hypothetical protein
VRGKSVKRQQTWFWVRKGQVETLPAQMGPFQIFCPLLQIVPIKKVLWPRVSQSIEHVVSKVRNIVLHRQMKDPITFVRKAFPDALKERRRDWTVALCLPASLVG